VFDLTKRRSPTMRLLGRLSGIGSGRDEGGVVKESTEKILATGATVSAILLSLTGGLAMVVRSLRNTDLSLSLSLTRATRVAQQDEGSEQTDDGFRARPPARVSR
jgi:hypothetical protein